jgi:hypothetical protein
MYVIINFDILKFNKGEKKVRLKSDVAKKLGIPQGSEDLIEVFTDENGNQVLRLKDGAKTVKIG